MSIYINVTPAAHVLINIAFLYIGIAAGIDYQKGKTTMKKTKRVYLTQSNKEFNRELAKNCIFTVLGAATFYIVIDWTINLLF